MEYHKLGKNGLKLSKIIMGCWGIGGGYTWGEVDEAESVKTIHAAISNGITSFDTAEMYSDGYSEEVLGKAIKGKASDIVISTKVRAENLESEKLVNACEGSLKRLGVDCIDLYQVHWPNPEVSFEETFSTLENLKKEGKIKNIGVCNFGKTNLTEAKKYTEIISNQLCYSILFRAIEFGLQDFCIDENIEILAYSPLAQGLLGGRYRTTDDVSDERARIRFYSKDRPGTVHQEEGYEDEIFKILGKYRKLCSDIGEPMYRVSLAWTLKRYGVNAVFAGAKTVSDIEKNISALDFNPDDEIIREIDNLSSELKNKMGDNADLWRTAGRVV